MPENSLTPPAPFPLDSNGVLKAPILDALPWLIHGFGTRLSPDWPESRVARGTFARLKQIHSHRVVEARSIPPDTITEGDALVSSDPGTVLCVRTADCVPILLAHPRSHAVAAIHAGWRGTLADVAGEAILSMRRLFDTVPAELIAAIGPGIGPCCFEVGPEVSVQFQGIFPERRDLGLRTRLDLAEANRREILGAGVAAENIAVDPRCTYCEADYFHSWRRENAAAGRMTAAIGRVY